MNQNYKINICQARNIVESGKINGNRWKNGHRGNMFPH